MQISIKKTASNYRADQYIIQELESRLSQHEATFPMEKALMLLNEAATLLETEDKYSDIYDAVMDVIDMFSKDLNKDIVEMHSSKDLEEEIQEEIEEQKEEE